MASVALAGFLVACGTQRVNVSKTNADVHNGALLFSQRCGGCHTLSYAGTHGSATNARNRLIVNGPNFNVRCERPIDRVLYAIANGGFSGAIMPQNIVTGQDAKDVAQFVATYAGRQAPKITGLQSCESTAIGSLPTANQTTASPTDTGTTPTTATSPQGQSALGNSGAAAKKKK